MTETIARLAENVKRNARRNQDRVVRECVKYLYNGSEYFPIHSHETEGNLYEVSRKYNEMDVKSEDPHILVVVVHHIPSDDDKFHRRGDDWDWTMKFDGVEYDDLDDGQFASLVKFLYEACELKLYDGYTP